jgi:hypothetical protein
MTRVLLLAVASAVVAAVILAPLVMALLSGVGD